MGGRPFAATPGSEVLDITPPRHLGYRGYGWGETGRLSRMASNERWDWTNGVWRLRKEVGPRRLVTIHILVYI
jgi:hypothetical protein